MKVLLGILAVIVIVAILIGAAFALEIGGLEWKKFFAPKHEAVRREVFKQTRSYNEGKEQELLKCRREYLLAKSPSDKAAIASTIRLSFADYDETLLTPELRGFLHTIKYSR